MKKIIFFLCFFFSVFSTPTIVMAEEERVVIIERLGIAPLSPRPLKSSEDVANLIAERKEEIVRFVQYDLEKAGIYVSFSQATAIVEKMEEKSRKGEIVKIIIPDRTQFKSMMWLRKGVPMRTGRCELRLGRATYGWEIEVKGEELKLIYVVLGECGNICVRSIEKLPDKKAEVVRQEVIREIIREVPAPPYSPPVLPGPPLGPSATQTRTPRFYAALAYGGTIYAEAEADENATDPSAIRRWGIGIGRSAEGAAAGAGAAMMGDPYGPTIGVGFGKRLITFTDYLAIVGGVGLAHSFDVQRTYGGVFVGLALSWPPAPDSSDSTMKWWGLGLRYKKSPKIKINPPTVETRSSF